MRTTDIIRNLLNLIDCIDDDQMKDQPTAVVSISSPAIQPSPENRFKQIMDLIAKERSSNLSNAPDEQYASIAAVTVDAGGGVNGPKHPADLRVKDPSIYPKF